MTVFWVLIVGGVAATLWSNRRRRPHVDRADRPATYVPDVYRLPAQPVPPVPPAPRAPLEMFAGRAAAPAKTAVAYRKRAIPGCQRPLR